jgi:hypothetical protein
MRAGVRFDGTRCIVVVVDADGMPAAEHTQSFDPERGMNEIFGWLARLPGAALESVTVDVSALLQAERQKRVIAIRISPRPAVDEIHEMPVSAELADSVSHTLHVTGGHDMRGRPLRDLGVASLRDALHQASGDAELVAAVTAVGSIANPDHEQRAADVILEAFPDARISLSHDFFSSAFRDRDFTATANAALLQSGEQLAAGIERAAREQLPGAAVSFGLNDGGRAPIRRLGATPVHAIRAAAALRVQGARHLADVDEGDLVIIEDDAAVVGHVHNGVPAAHTVVKRGREPSLASNGARVDTYSPTMLSDLLSPAAVVDARADVSRMPPFTPAPGLRAGVDLGALGAAVAPLSSWSDYLGHASNATELQAVLRLTEEELRSQTIHWGAAPDCTRVVESNAYTLAYGSRNVVRIRVRVTGDWMTAAALADAAVVA